MLEILRPGAPGREDDFALGFGGDRRGRLRDLRLQLADVEPGHLRLHDDLLGLLRRARKGASRLLFKNSSDKLIL